MLEREGKLLGCAMLQPLERGSDGIKSAELAAFCVHPSYRGSGRGDSLLDFLGELVPKYPRNPFFLMWICLYLKYSQCLGLLREEVHAINGLFFGAERKAANSGTGRVVLMTTRTADWFEQRGFQPAGAAHSSTLLPASRRDKVHSIPNTSFCAHCCRRVL